MVIFVTITGCSMSYTAQKLSQKNTWNSWSVDFKYLKGDLSHTLSRKDGKPSTINVNSIVQSGSLVLQVQLEDKIEKIQIGNQKVDLSKWDNGDFILRIITDNSQNGHVDFSWE